MRINDHKKEFIDKESFRILELFDVTEEEKSNLQFVEGSQKHKIIPIETLKLDDRPVINSIANFNLQTVSIQECYKGKCIGLNELNYKVFQKFVNTILQEKDLNKLVSKEFIERKSLHWLLKTFREKRAESNFSAYILDEILNSIEEVKVHYSLLYLDIERPFKIGNVQFEFFTPEYFDSLIEEYKINHNENEENPYVKLRSKYQGNVYATFVVKAEINKAKEIALEECSLAVDILKICSDTTDFPELKLSFDIDCRTNEKDQSELIITKPDRPARTFSIELYRIPMSYKIGEQEWNRMKKRQLDVFNNFLLGLEKDKTELQQLVINGIRRFGNAISNINLYQRIVELFTILESLLLIDANSQIIESVCKYSSKLVFKKSTDRLDLIKLLKKLYKVRSAIMHHATETKFELDELRKLQIVVRALLVNIIAKTTTHKTKYSLLHEIDEAILTAYQ